MNADGLFSDCLLSQAGRRIETFFSGITDVVLLLPATLEYIGIRT